MNLEYLDELLDAHFLGELSPEKADQLQEFLRTDPAARARFVQSIYIETGLHDLVRTQTAPRTQRNTTAESARPASSIRLRRLAYAAAILMAVGAVALFKFSNPEPNTSARVASGNVLVDGRSVERISEGATLSVTGTTPAVIHLPDGSQATLDPATRLTLRGRVDSIRQVLQLAAGGGQFHVSHGGGQFKIETPVGSVTVLGTEFSAVLRTPQTLFLSVKTGSVRFDGKDLASTLGAGQSRTFGQQPDAGRTPVPVQKEASPSIGVPPAIDNKPRTQIMQGWIRAVDVQAKTFVLGGENESQTTFRVAVALEGRREAAHILLDGKKATFEDAVQAQRKATVTYVKVADKDLWVWKVDVSTAEK